MKVVLISGKAQNGKDTTANIMKRLLEADGEKVLIAHYGDLVKYICKQFFDWDGNKDEKGRTLLQYVGTDVIRAKNPDYWVNFIIGVLKMFDNEWDFVLIPDARFPNEVDFVKHEFDALHLRVIRENFTSPLTPEQQAHPSETSLDDVTPDYTVINDGTIEDLKAKLSTLVTQLRGSHQLQIEDGGIY